MISRQEKIRLARQMVLEPSKDICRDNVPADIDKLERKKGVQSFLIRLSISMLIGIGCYMADSLEKQPAWYEQLKQQKNYLEQSVDYQSVQNTLQKKYVSVVEKYVK